MYNINDIQGNQFYKAITNFDSGYFECYDQFNDKDWEMAIQYSGITIEMTFEYIDIVTMVFRDSEGDLLNNDNSERILIFDGLSIATDALRYWLKNSQHERKFIVEVPY